MGVLSSEPNQRVSSAFLLINEYAQSSALRGGELESYVIVESHPIGQYSSGISPGLAALLLQFLT